MLLAPVEFVYIVYFAQVPFLCCLDNVAYVAQLSFPYYFHDIVLSFPYYLDNIAYAQTYLDEKDRKVVKFRIIGCEITAIPIEECAYLLNDNGKTIDTI